MRQTPGAHNRIVVGTRRSALARWQTAHVAGCLAEAGFAIEVVDITTRGDKILDVPLSKVGGKGLFTRELDTALLDGRIDIAVHSLKDLPIRLPDGLVLAAVVERAEPWDAFVAGPDFEGRLSDLPPAARLATSSLRRAAQLLAWRPDLEIVSVRGNVDTRLDKLARHRWEGLVLAEVGLRRLGLDHHIRERFPHDVMLPAVGQGAIAVVAAERSVDLVAILHERLEHGPSRDAVTAERAFLARLEGGCQVPVGAYAEVTSNGSLMLEGCVASLDGRTVLRDCIRGPQDDAAALGAELAEQLRAHGADRILRHIPASVASAAETVKEPYVLLLRASGAEDPFVAALEAAGYDVHCLPLLEYEFVNEGALAEELARANQYAGLVFTSPRALDAISASKEAEAEVRTRWVDKTAFTVGPETTARARALGLTAQGEQTGTSADLAAFIVDQKPQQPLLFLAGWPRRNELPHILADHQVDVQEVVVYRAQARTRLALPQPGVPDWVVFFSPHGVGHAAENLALAWEHVKKAAIGPTTGQAIRNQGWIVEAIAEAPAPNALIAAISYQSA